MFVVYNFAIHVLKNTHSVLIQILASVARQKYPLTIGDSAFASTTVSPVLLDLYLMMGRPSDRRKLEIFCQWELSSIRLSSTSSLSATILAGFLGSDALTLDFLIESPILFPFGLTKFAGVTTWTRSFKMSQQCFYSELLLTHKC